MTESGSSLPFEFASPTLSEEEFFSRLEIAISSGDELDLTCEVVLIKKVIRPKRSGSVRIKNGVIIGQSSTIFSLGTDRKTGPPALILEGTKLIHHFECHDNQSPYAAIFAQGKARVELDNTVIESAFGFGLWAKHGSQTVLRNCTISKAGCSAVACYNSSRVDLFDSVISNSKIHGICVRGTSKVYGRNCRILESVENAVVVYQQGCLTLHSCILSNTLSVLHAALHVDATENYDSASVELIECSICENAGPSVTFRGKVAHNIEDEKANNTINGKVVLQVKDESNTSSDLVFKSCDEDPTYRNSFPLSTMTEKCFEDQVRAALSSSTCLDLSNHTVVITKPISIPNQKSLSILNGTLIGDCHSIFLLDTDADGKITLSLQGTVLSHLFFSAEKRGIGAAIFVQNKAKVHLTNVRIESKYGFGLWMKHEGQATVNGCVFNDIGRTAVACFNDVRVQLLNCRIVNVKVHGVCVRGTSEVTLMHCDISYCGTRAAFVYQRGSLILKECSISKTLNSGTPAVHAEAAGSKDACFILLSKCKIFDNQGPSVVVAGKAKYEFSNNDLEQDSLPIFAPDVCETTIPRPWAAPENDCNAVLLS